MTVWYCYRIHSSAFYLYQYKKFLQLFPQKEKDHSLSKKAVILFSIKKYYPLRKIYYQR